MATTLAHPARAQQQQQQQQQQRRIVVRVRVVDTTAAPIAGAEVSIVRGLNTQAASAPTDAMGEHVFSVVRDDDPYQIVVRRIGYQRAERFFARPVADTVAFQIDLHRSVQALAPVTVTAGENRTARHYHVDADEIANTPRVILDGTDVLTVLRPEMMGTQDCPLQHVWVNGRRIEYAPPNEIALMRRGRTPAPAPPPTLVFQGDGSSGRALPSAPSQRVADDPWSVLASIKPEHILEINYIDCYIHDPVHQKNSEDAVYVVLKPGIDFEPGTGSFVVDTALTAQANTLPPLRAGASGASDAALGYRRRLLGVYDSRNGSPIAGAEVIDLATGLRSRTSATGTVSLFYLEEGENTIRIHRDGYRDLEMAVTIGPGVVNPITLVLDPTP